MYNELYSQLFDGISVDVTVTYNDGTEETQTVDLFGELLPRKMQTNISKKTDMTAQTAACSP